MLFWVYYIWYDISDGNPWARIFSNVTISYPTDFFLLAKFAISTCGLLERMVVVFLCAVLVFTSLLFFFRTRAIFQGNHWVTAFFAGLWLAVLGGCLALIVEAFKPVMVNTDSNTIEICLDSGFNPFVAAATIIPLINDTLVFLAITWRLSRNSYIPGPYTLKSRIRFLIFGDYLPVFSKVLFRDGQAYYLLVLFLTRIYVLINAWITHKVFLFLSNRTIITMNIISVIMLFYPSNSDILRTIFVVPNVVVMNVMAGRAFKNTILSKSLIGSENSTVRLQEM